jgi:cytochrome c-type biogenesis protein
VHPQLNIATAFLAGLISFVSPCVLPLIPAYLSFLTGSSLEELKAEGSAQRTRVLFHALSFVAGFTVVFMLIGLSASAIGGVFSGESCLPWFGGSSICRTGKDWIALAGGAIIIVLGLNMIGVFKIPFLAMDKRLQVRSANRSFVASFFVGIGFAAGWSPCIGPILSGIILLASQERLAPATFLLFVYSMGLAIPFLVTAGAITQALGALGRIKRYLGAIEIGAGAFLVATGVVLITGSFTRITGLFYQYVPYSHTY